MTSSADPTHRPAPLRFGLQRRERLLDELRSAGSISVSDVAGRFGVSELTIRRDVNALAQQGLVTRVHGGATLPSNLDRVPAAGPDGQRVASRFTVGMVVPSLDYYWPQAINGARAAASRAQSRLVIRGSSYDLKDNRKQIQALVGTGKMHGLIVAPDISGPEGARLLRWLDSLPIPVVLVERRPPEGLALRHLESVSTDHAFGAGLAIRHLNDAGHEHIGLLASPGSPTSKHVERGWRTTLASLGLSTETALFADAVGFNSRDREQVIDAILERCTETGTTALVVHSDPQAVAVVQHCVDRGISIPEDLAIVAYDDEVAHLGQPPITAVRPPKQHVGRIALELLVARLEEGAARPISHVFVNPALVVRGSSIVRVDDGELATDM
ncbi:substrate-binding domain-containing protein [Enemella evansiae]|uniref:substrate-binding domain-containing protein n=1 Tax=Enemella evansiae TaxID=2016499 RepID=UPI000B96085D|nr:substrate-binding domain-containing protein [Enemella evansiae]OYN99126.1 DNA-binding transcriptional regulator [Enemella evansiae]OYO05216.1 DNA-binding transcriptional regulator [Enemella evansiae]PFG67338.1 DNA-binding LacI/PurR family transcriptional regulator [Propionibacteriaceae bacterium ES.041]